MAAGAVFTGSGSQLDRIMQQQLFALKTVKTIDYVGYSKEHSCYVFGDLAVRGGVLETANAEDYFEFKGLRLKTLQKSIKLEINQTHRGTDRTGSSGCGRASTLRASLPSPSGSVRCSPSRSVPSSSHSRSRSDRRGRRR